MQALLSNPRRIILKLGTQVVVDEDGQVARERLSHWVQQCAFCHQQGRQVLVVSSGAVGMGRSALNQLGPLALAEKQACAAVGQALLMDLYRELFYHHGLLTAQVLLTASDFSNRRHYENLQKTLESLLAFGVIPIINENDTVSTAELEEKAESKSFGDNDKLSALVAAKLKADLLVILTNVDGIYTENPAQNPNAQKIPVIEHLDQLATIQTQGQSTLGRGGMGSKLEAARLAAMSGVTTWILSGASHRDGVMPQMASYLESEKEISSFPGTLILPQGNLPERKRWIGMASGYQGVVVINEGARKALVERQASLLPSGVVRVEGSFTSGQVVSIQDERGDEVGRGVVSFSFEEVQKIQGCHTREIQPRLGTSAPEEVVHRDRLVIFAEYGG